jgi:hypothetical protein
LYTISSSIGPIVKTVIFLVLACTVLSPAQQRFLVSPNGDARALTGRESATGIVRAEASRAFSAVCSNKGTFGYSRAQYPGANVQVEAFHRDIMAMWYVAPANGTIDTVFVYNLDVGTQDSTVTVRLFNSNVYPGNGPGYDGYPSPGKLCWGYYLSTNDNDNGLAAFPEDATDTTWYSTVPGAIPSSTPMGSEIWGFGGFPKVMNAYATNDIALADLAPLNVTAGQPFFITVRMYGPHREQVDDKRTGYLAVTESDSLQTHNWKFYEHIYQGPGFTCPGWVARGDFNYLIWYSMTVTTNLPPTFSDVTTIANTFSTDDQPVQAMIIDCDAAVPGRAGVERAVLRYTRNDAPQPDITLSYLGGDVWEGAIPGGSVNDRINYRVVASDSTGFADSTAATEYRIVSLSNAWYAADTGASCAPRDIRLTGTSIPSPAWFVPAFPGSGTLPKDDGTAGPFDMGNAFTVFGDTFRYAWIGVNGGLALGKSPLDTLDVNSNGFGTRLWDFPGAQKSGRDDTAGAYDMPGMFIAPFWADMIAGSGATDYGRVVYGDDGDPCLFIAEWDSLGAFDSGDPVADRTTFRAVLNRCTGSVEFQYDDVGSYGLESVALVGMQADSGAASGPEPGWVYVNRDAAPAATTPRNGWCVRFSPTIGTLALDGWNMVAVSLEPADGDYRKTTLFPGSVTPGAVSAGYGYYAGYLQSDSLRPGLGYWLKFNAAGRAGVSAGSFVNAVTAQVRDKWNMIGGPTGNVPVASITATGTSVASSFFGYGTSGYYSTTVIREGQGYWVKVVGSGSLDLVSSAALPKAPPPEPQAADPSKLNALTILDAAGRRTTLWFGEPSATGGNSGLFELPPPPPAGAFDARFASGRYVETYESAGAQRVDVVLPLSVTGAAWPLTVTWEIRKYPDNGTQIVLASGAGAAIRPLEGSGSVVVRTEPAGGLALRLTGDAALPAAYALGSNYPNPFNPSTRFQVSLATDGPVKVAVYDLLGREVRTLADERKSAGVQTIEWDGRDAAGAFAPSGVYIVRMVAGGFTASKKIVLMK